MGRNYERMCRSLHTSRQARFHTTVLNTEIQIKIIHLYTAFFPRTEERTITDFKIYSFGWYMHILLLRQSVTCFLSALIKKKAKK